VQPTLQQRLPAQPQVRLQLAQRLPAQPQVRLQRTQARLQVQERQALRDVHCSDRRVGMG
jgi:hypothetical protein